VPAKKKHPARRWAVERTLAWLSKHRGLPVRYEKESEYYLALVQFASVKLPAGIREITSDWLVKLPGWDGETLLRMVSDKLTDGKLIRVLTSRHDLMVFAMLLRCKRR